MKSLRAKAVVALVLLTFVCVGSQSLVLENSLLEWAGIAGYRAIITTSSGELYSLTSAKGDSVLLNVVHLDFALLTVKPIASGPSYFFLYNATSLVLRTNGLKLSTVVDTASPVAVFQRASCPNPSGNVAILSFCANCPITTITNFTLQCIDRPERCRQPMHLVHLAWQISNPYACNLYEKSDKGNYILIEPGIKSSGTVDLTTDSSIDPVVVFMIHCEGVNTVSAFVTG